MTSFKPLAIGSALLLTLAACSQPGPQSDVVAVYAKDGSIAGYQRMSDGAPVDADGNPLSAASMDDNMDIDQGVTVR